MITKLIDALLGLTYSKGYTGRHRASLVTARATTRTRTRAAGLSRRATSL